MATFVPVLGVKLIVRGTNQGRPQSFSLWAGKAVPIAPAYADLTGLAAAVGGALTGNAFLADFAASLAITGVEAHDASAERGPSATYPLALVGTAATANPNATAAKVFLTPAGSAAFRRPSQVYLPALPASATGTADQSDTLTAAYIAASQTFIGTLQAAIASVGTFELVAVSKYFNAAPRGTALMAPVATIVTRPTVATQIRRQRRVHRTGA